MVCFGVGEIITPFLIGLIKNQRKVALVSIALSLISCILIISCTHFLKFGALTYAAAMAQGAMDGALNLHIFNILGF